jgi:hypothetical protein
MKSQSVSLRGEAREVERIAAVIESDTTRGEDGEPQKQ